MQLSPEQLEFFAENGYIHLRNIVPQHMVQKALSIIDAAYEAKDYDVSDANPWDIVPSFRDNIKTHPEILTIFNSTCLFDMCQQLLGHGKAFGVGRAQVALREPNQVMRQRGMGLHDIADAKSWHIDGGTGKHAHLASPFTLLVGVALSDGQDVDENRGQLLVWPKSHRVIHPVVAERVRKGLVKDGLSIFGGDRKNKPDVGLPMRVLMKSGDVVLAHQRLAHSGGPNLSTLIRKNLYFRVFHKHHQQNLASGAILNGSVFTEYEGIREISRKYG